VEGVGGEWGKLEEVELLESVFGGDAGAGAGTGGATGGAGFVAGGVVPASIGPHGCSLCIEVQLYWNSGILSSLPVRNLVMSPVLNFVHKFCSVVVNCSKVASSLIKSFCAIFINGSRKLSAIPIFNLVSMLLI